MRRPLTNAAYDVRACLPLICRFEGGKKTAESPGSKIHKFQEVPEP